MFYDAIYLSPHLDDAALSCGGQIAQRTAAGQAILIITPMAGDPPDIPLSPYAQAMHDRWGLRRDVVSKRRQEDAAASHILGAHYGHWSIPDCIYRRDEDGRFLYHSDSDIFGTIHPADQFLIAKLAQQMRELPACGEVIAPLAIGNHVDHQLVHLAAKQSFPDCLFYYEDYPYAQAPGAVAQVVAKRGWHPHVQEIEPAALAQKFEAVSAYSSQIGMFFRDRADLETQIGRYAAQVGGECLWQFERP